MMRAAVTPAGAEESILTFPGDGVWAFGDVGWRPAL